MTHLSNTCKLNELFYKDKGELEYISAMQIYIRQDKAGENLAKGLLTLTL